MTAAGDLATYKDALLVLGTAGVVVPLLHATASAPSSRFCSPAHF